MKPGQMIPVREDVRDLVHQITPWDVPLMWNGVPMVTAAQYPEWTTKQKQMLEKLAETPHVPKDKVFQPVKRRSFWDWVQGIPKEGS